MHPTEHGHSVGFGDATGHMEIVFWRDARRAQALEFVPRACGAVPFVDNAVTTPRDEDWLEAWRAADRAVTQRGRAIDLTPLRPGVSVEEDVRLHGEWSAQLPDFSRDERDRVAAAVRDEDLLSPKMDVWLGVLPLEREFRYLIGPGAVLADRGILADSRRLREELRRAARR